MLRQRRAARTEKYVFPTGRPPGYFTDPRWWMKKVTEDSGVAFTIHDLRRTFATVAERLDISAYAIKCLLTQRVNKADVTAGYIVADVERLRKPMQTITDFLLSAGNVKARGSSARVQPEAEVSGSTRNSSVWQKPHRFPGVVLGACRDTALGEPAVGRHLIQSDLLHEHSEVISTEPGASKACLHIFGRDSRVGNRFRLVSELLVQLVCESPVAS